MKIKALHPNFSLPLRSTEWAGGYDLFMPEPGFIPEMVEKPVKVSLGFAAEVPKNHIALILPRSSAGAKYGVELQNTAGVVDSDYRGEWFAFLNTKTREAFEWDAGSRVVQMLIIPIATPELTLVDELAETVRNTGGFGSTGQ